MSIYCATTHFPIVYSYLYYNIGTQTNANTKTAPRATDAEILVDDLYANMNLKVDATSHISSSGMEQNYKISMFLESLPAAPLLESHIMDLPQ